MGVVNPQVRIILPTRCSPEGGGEPVGSDLLDDPVQSGGGNPLNRGTIVLGA